MPAIPHPTALVVAHATPSSRSLNISKDTLTAQPSDGFDPSSGSDVVEIVLIIGILVSGILLVGMLASFILHAPKTGGPLTFVEWWTYANMQILGACFTGLGEGLPGSRPQAEPNPPVRTHTPPPNATPEPPAESLESPSIAEQATSDVSPAQNASLPHTSSLLRLSPPAHDPTH